MTDRQIIHELVCSMDVFNMQVRPGGCAFRNWTWQFGGFNGAVACAPHVRKLQINTGTQGQSPLQQDLQPPSQPATPRGDTDSQPQTPSERQTWVSFMSALGSSGKHLFQGFHFCLNEPQCSNSLQSQHCGTRLIDKDSCHNLSRHIGGDIFLVILQKKMLSPSPWKQRLGEKKENPCPALRPG